MPLQCRIITYSAMLTNLNLFNGVQPILCVLTTDRHPSSHPWDSLQQRRAHNRVWMLYRILNMAWSQYHLITSSRPQLLPEDTKPTACKSGATPVCTARRSSQVQSDYGTAHTGVNLSLGQFRRALKTHLFDCVCRA